VTAQYLRAEFTIEPWQEGGHPAYVQAALAVAESSGLAVDLGPFGTGVEGPAVDVYLLIPLVLEAALESGADRVSFQVSRCQATAVTDSTNC